MKTLRLFQDIDDSCRNHFKDTFKHIDHEFEKIYLDSLIDSQEYLWNDIEEEIAIRILCGKELSEIGSNLSRIFFKSLT